MAQLKAHEADRFIERPDWRQSIFLIYGPDHGLIAERGRQLAKATGVPIDDPFSAVRLDQDALKADPDRLINEAYTIAMFGGRRLIWLRGATTDKILTSQIERLLADPPPETIVIIEAGDLKKGGMRAIVEKASAGLAIPCYADNDRAIAGLIERTFTDTGQKLDLDARQFLMTHLGGDRAASRAELDKVVHYTKGLSTIRLDDVRAVCGDASLLGFDEIADAVMVGDLNGFDRAMTKFESGGNASSALFAMLVRQFQMLHRLRAQMSLNGQTTAAAVTQAKPPIFFARRKTVEHALSIWTPPAIGAALDRLREATLASRKHRELDNDIARLALLALTVQGARRQQ